MYDLWKYHLVSTLTVQPTGCEVFNWDVYHILTNGTKSSRYDEETWWCVCVLLLFSRPCRRITWRRFVPMDLPTCPGSSLRSIDRWLLVQEQVTFVSMEEEPFSSHPFSSDRLEISWFVYETSFSQDLSCGGYGVTMHWWSVCCWRDTKKSIRVRLLWVLEPFTLFFYSFVTPSSFSSSTGVCPRGGLWRQKYRRDPVLTTPSL